jgi:alkylation response protein AidB-like acyl-CoA dehydrogenase
VLPVDDSFPDFVTAACELSSDISKARDDIEQWRSIPNHLADALDAAGFYRLYVPKSLGGLEAPPQTVFEVIEALSTADAAVGWCLMNAIGIGLATAWLAPDTARAMFGEPIQLRAAGSLRPLGRAVPVEGGFRVTGRWNFASGIHNANWMYCPCVVMDGNKPSITQAGTPLARTMWIRHADITLIDNWSVMGLRGTGSHDFAVESFFVPQAHSVSVAESAYQTGPLYKSRTFLALFHLLFAANALGIARAAQDTLIQMAAHEASSLSPVLLQDRATVQACVGKSEAIINAARGYVVDALARCWAVAQTDGEPSREIAQLRLAIPHAIHESVRAVDLIYHAAGTNAIYTSNKLERMFRDIHVAVQHYAAFPVHFESGGKVLLGLKPSDPGW